MHLLVTGGAGFIGSNFAEMALGKGARVTILDSLTYASNRDFIESLTGYYPNRCELVVDTILHREAVFDLAHEVDAIVHFAAESHNDNSYRDPMRFVRTNVEGTAMLLEAAREYDVRFHHISTDEVYGDLPLRQEPAATSDNPAVPATPDSPAVVAASALSAAPDGLALLATQSSFTAPAASATPNEAAQKFTELSPYRPSSPYSATKAAADHLVRAWVRSFGLNATISNCSNNFGPHQHVEKLIPRTITERLLGRRPRVYGEGRNVRDWIHVDDHNEALWQILTRGRIGETYLIGANLERSNLEVVQTINELMGAPANDIQFVSDRPGHDLRYAIDATKLREELGWRPTHTDFRAGLKATIDWYTKNRAWWSQKATTEARLSKWGL